MASPGMEDLPRKLRTCRRREDDAADQNDRAGPSQPAARQTRRARTTPGDTAEPSQQQTGRAAVSHPEEDDDEPGVIDEDGPEDEATEMRRIQRKMADIKERTREAQTDLQTTLTDMEEERLVREVMRFMIFRQGEKPDVPVPRGDLPTAGHGKATGAKGTRVIRLAQGRFAESMGLEMEELTLSGGDSKGYILRSLVPGRLRAEHVLVPERAADRGFETMVLAMITMNGEAMREDDLWMHLEGVGIDRSAKGKAGGHPVFGRVEDKLKHMISKRYLTLAKGTGPDKVNSYGIGVNAEQEIGTARLAAYVQATFNSPAAAVAADDADSS